MALNIIIVTVIILLGLLFLMIEIFLLPGISIAGIAGIIFLIGGIVFAFTYIGSTAGTITLIASVVLIAVTFVLLLRSKSLKKIALNTEITSTVDNSDFKNINVGDKGVTISRLNPMGKVMVNNVIVEAKTYDGGMIDEETEIIVEKVESMNIIVRKSY
ncbi:MAG: NfeD family protein [Dysgonamonadaceae bacterium]|jgi:membrane-bound ClpP family serine protease|nr:NfeD family protein [Dysgonamonadaceae bacterium]MDD3308964.1 NfeD family protein [Dysgonamonadaceae bacterium]MDD3900844.1 NfeD family protein [Dysgonamonadaceae bacterium]MDD4398066.1 NfeD family protein [Dysgonamonadaceae bacterium]MEA5081713.1 NfeD family protein [Dysgonamonadaceae bacterium]